MKTTEASPRPRYRNDAVYRSALRLSASRHSARKPAKLPRSFYFAAGLAIGLGLAVVIPTLWFASRPPTAQLPLPAITPTHTASVRPAAAKPKPIVIPTQPARAPAPVVLTPARETRVAESEAAALAARQRALIASFVVEVPPAAPRGRTNTYTIVSRILAELRLRGQMLSEDTSAIAIEFELARISRGEGNTISGVVRYSEVNGPPIAAVHVEGVLQNGAILLRETTPGGALRPSFPLGRKFEIQLPEERARPDVVGIWSLGGLRGTLELAVVPPAELARRAR